MEMEVLLTLKGSDLPASGMMQQSYMKMVFVNVCSSEEYARPSIFVHYLYLLELNRLCSCSTVASVVSNKFDPDVTVVVVSNPSNHYLK